MTPSFPHPNQGTVLWNTAHIPSGLRLRGFHPLWRAVPGHFGFAGEECGRSTTPHPPWVSPRGLVWTLPLSVAPTQGIPVGFFSSPYLDASVRGVPAPLWEHRRLPKEPTVGGPIRGSPDLRLHAPTRGLSRLAAPFFGAQAEPSTRRRGVSGLNPADVCWLLGVARRWLARGLCVVFTVSLRF